MLFIGSHADLGVTNGDIRELVGLRSDGYKFPIEANISRVTLGNGRDKGFLVGLFRDITRRQQAEANYKSIFENAIEGIFQSTPEGKFIMANPALARLYGFNMPDEMTDHFSDIQTQLYVDPNLREKFLKEMNEQGSVVHFEYEVFRRDGSTIWISESARAVKNEAGQVLYYEGRVMDITARIKARKSSGSRMPICDSFSTAPLLPLCTWTHLPTSSK